MSFNMVVTPEVPEPSFNSYQALPLELFFFHLYRKQPSVPEGEHNT